ncbi:MAG: twin-arginine translocase subunit TatC [Nitriliruptoraceae bacterium]
MTLFEHLAELRSRLLRALAALIVGTVVGYLVFPEVLVLLMRPYCAVSADVAALTGDCRLIALRPLEPFSVRIKTSVVIGLFVAGPVISWQLWRFVTPGLTTRERRYSLPFVLVTQIMFAAGVAFAYLVIPQGLRILLNMGGPNIDALLSANEYLTFFLTMSAAFGLVFELPVLLIFLALVGVVSRASLQRARPYAVVAMFIVAAIITPTTDAVTLLLLAVPMMLFYELSVLVAWLIERSRREPAR